MIGFDSIQEDNVRRMRVAVLVIAALATSGAASTSLSPGYEDLVVKFFDRINEGKPDVAIDTLYKTNPYSEKIADAVQGLKSQLVSTTALVGTYRGSLQITRKELGDRLAYLCYVAVYDRQPIRFEFFFYKPGEKWVLQQMTYDDKFLDDIRELSKQDLIQKLK